MDVQRGKDAASLFRVIASLEMSATSGSGFLLSVRLLVSVVAVALAHALIRLFVSIFACPVVSGRAWFLVFQCCRVLGASRSRGDVWVGFRRVGATGSWVQREAEPLRGDVWVWGWGNRSVTRSVVPFVITNYQPRKRSFRVSLDTPRQGAYRPFPIPDLLFFSLLRGVGWAQGRWAR